MNQPNTSTVLQDFDSLRSVMPPVRNQDSKRLLKAHDSGTLVSGSSAIPKHLRSTRRGAADGVVDDIDFAEEIVSDREERRRAVERSASQLQARYSCFLLAKLRGRRF